MVVWGKGGKVIEIPFAVRAVGTVYYTKQAHKAHTNDLEKNPTKKYYCEWCQTTVKCKVLMEDKKRARLCKVDTWRLMDDALVKGKAHQARGSEYDLFMAHREVLQPTERQRLTREGEIVRFTCVSEVSH